MNRAEIEAMIENRQALRHVNLSHVNLSSLDLHAADLNYANLSYAYLHDTNLRHAYLTCADLSCADLHGANLGYADLSHAYLYNANLSHVNLSHADLSHTNLNNVNLQGANLEGASLPDGWGWWQGGSYGPRRRMVRVLRRPDGTVTVTLGCISGTPEEVMRRLHVERLAPWAIEVGAFKARAAIEQVETLIDIALKDLTT